MKIDYLVTMGKFEMVWAKEFVRIKKEKKWALDDIDGNLMGKFEGDLILRYLHQPVGGKWFETVSSFGYTSNAGELYIIPAGLKTDFASVPRGFLWLIDSIGKYGRATVFHDWLCESKIVNRKKADKLFLEAMEALGVGWLKRKVMYRAVRGYSIITRKK